MIGHGEKRYRVKIVGEDVLACGQDFVFVECGGELWLMLRQSRLGEELLENVWNTYREMGRRVIDRAGPHIPVPGCCPLTGHRVSA